MDLVQFVAVKMRVDGADPAVLLHEVPVGSKVGGGQRAAGGARMALDCIGHLAAIERFGAVTGEQAEGARCTGQREVFADGGCQSRGMKCSA